MTAFYCLDQSFFVILARRIFYSVLNGNEIIHKSLFFFYFDLFLGDKITTFPSDVQMALHSGKDKFEIINNNLYSKIDFDFEKNNVSFANVIILL